MFDLQTCAIRFGVGALAFLRVQIDEYNRVDENIDEVLLWRICVELSV